MDVNYRPAKVPRISQSAQRMQQRAGRSGMQPSNVTDNNINASGDDGRGEDLHPVAGPDGTSTSDEEGSGEEGLKEDDVEKEEGEEEEEDEDLLARDDGVLQAPGLR